MREISETHLEPNSRTSRPNLQNEQNICFHWNYQIDQSDWWKTPLYNLQNEETKPSELHKN